MLCPPHPPLTVTSSSHSPSHRESLLREKEIPIPKTAFVTAPTANSICAAQKRGESNLILASYDITHAPHCAKSKVRARQPLAPTRSLHPRRSTHQQPNLRALVPLWFSPPIDDRNQPPRIGSSIGNSPTLGVLVLGFSKCFVIRHL